MHLLPLLETLPFGSHAELKQTHTGLQKCLLALPHSVHHALPWGHLSMHLGNQDSARCHAQLERIASSQICIWLFLGLQSSSACTHNSETSHKSQLVPSASDDHLPNLRDLGHHPKGQAVSKCYVLCCPCLQSFLQPDFLWLPQL